MRTPIHWFLIALLLGCERLPDELVYTSGTLLLQDGTPAVGAKVELFRAIGDGYCSEALAPEEVSGLPPVEFEPFLENVTDANGNFLFEMFYAQTDDTQCFRLHHRSERGAEVTASFNVYDGDALLAPLTFQDEVPVVDQEDAGPTLRITTEPPLADSHPLLKRWGLHSWRAWEVWAGTAASTTDPRALPLFALPVDGSAPALDPRVLEDAILPTVTVGGQGGYWRQQKDDGRPIELGGEVDYVFRTRTGQASLLATGPVVPASRGQRCTYETLEGPASQTCPFTDGVLDSLQPWTGRTLELELDRAIQPRFLILRGLYASLDAGPMPVWLEGATSEGTWEILAVFNVPMMVATPEVYLPEEGSAWEQSDNYFYPVLGYLAAPINAEGRFARFRISTEQGSSGREVEDGWLQRMFLAEVSLFE